MTKYKKHLISTTTFLITLALCLSLTALYIHNKSNLDYTRMGLLLNTHANKVSGIVEKLLYKTQALAALVIQDNGEVTDFARVAATLVDDPCIRNVILAPNGVVSDVYPLAGNENVIGFNYFSQSAGNVEAIKARDSGQLVLGGPFELVQGGQALVGRYPVYWDKIQDEEHFWGIVSITLNFPDVFAAAELEQLHLQDLAYEIWRINPDTHEKQIIVGSNYAYNHNTPYVEQKLELLNAEWYFRLSPVAAWYEYPETWIFAVCSIALSIALSLLVRHNFDLNTMGKELARISYCDVLTGALNRRGFFQELEALAASEQKTPFTLCYIDLNKFKSINDNYGHAAGDTALQCFYSCAKKVIPSQDCIARIGGDEFIILFKSTADMQQTQDFLSRIAQAMLQTPYPLDFSYGLARYPEDGKNIDELLLAADKKMYAAKNTMR